MNSKIVFVLLILVVGIGVYFFTRTPDAIVTGVNNGNGTGTSTNQNSTTTGLGGVSSANAITLAQNNTGNFALVSNAKLSKPGYVVIHRVNSNSDSEIIGNSDLLSASTHTNINIQLDKPVAKGQTLVAVLHEDDGDGRFEFPTADFYLGDKTMRVVSDADIVDVEQVDEPALLKNQVELFLEKTTSSTTATTS